MEIIISFLMALGGLFGTQGTLEYKSFDVEAVRASVEDSGKVLILFRADWCGPCKKFKNGPLKDPRYIEAASKIPLYVVDLTTNRSEDWDILKSYGGSGIPFVVILDKQGVVYKGRDIEQIIKNL